MPRHTELFVVLLAATAPTQQRAIELVPFPGTADSSRCMAIAEGPDRRLWLGYLERLQCHDGSQVKDVELGDAGRDQGRPTLRVMRTTADGALWVGTDRGVWRVPPGELRAERVAGTEEWPIAAMVAGPGGGVLVRTDHELRKLQDGAPACGVTAPEHGTTLVGMVGGPSRLWAWSRSKLWTAAGDPEPLDWQLVDTAPVGILAAVVDGEHLLCATETGVFRVDPVGPSRQLTGATGLGSTLRIVADAATVWLSDFERLRALPRDGGPVRDVALFSRGQPCVGTTLYSMEVDGQGLLWLGTARGVHRAAVPIGITNWLVSALAPTDRVTAMAEDLEGGTVLGTEHGLLLRGNHDAWQPIGLPWPVTPARQVPIEALQHGADGALFVGTLRQGLWQLHGGRLEQVGADQGIRGVRAMALGSDGSLWITHDKGNAWRRHPDGRIEAIPLWSSRPELAAVPSTLHCDGRGTLWLGSYREGLARHSPEAGRFVGHGSSWQDDAVMNVFSLPGDGPLWATSAEGLWQVDPVGGTRRMLRPTPRGDPVRSAAASPNGSLWLALRSQLMRFDPHSGHAEELAPRFGAHPRGYSFRSDLARKNGEIWFGAAGGYTCITRAAAAKVCLTDVRVQVAGVARAALAGPNPRFTLHEGDGPLTLEPTLIDRTLDEPPPYEVILREHHGNTQHQAAEGVFHDLPVGEYDANVTVSLPTGSVRNVPIGHIAVLPRPSPWPLALAIVAACGTFGALTWRRLRARSARSSRRVTLGRRLGQQGHLPDETLDIAFLAVSCAEECFRRSRVAHASVWLARKDDGQRLLLAEFGLQRDDADRRARRCRSEGLAVRDSWRLLGKHEQQDLVLHLHAADSLEFEVLLHDLQHVDAPLLDGLELAAAPLLSALRKQNWIDRLEADYAAKSSRFEADAHDARSPRTTLRMCAYEITARTADLADRQLLDCAATLAEAAEQVIASIERMVQHLSQSSPLHLQPTDPVAALRARLKALAPIAQGKQIEIDVDLPAEGALAALDVAWFDRVVCNVVGNAVKYSPSGSRVLVHGTTTEHEILIHVDDQGPGFLATERESVFLPGMTGSARPTAGEPKTGMGLWIARQAMRSMGGRLWIGTRPGPGARVSFSLPRHDRAGRVQPTP